MNWMPTHTVRRFHTTGLQGATQSVFAFSMATLIGVALLNTYGSTLPVSLYAAAMTGATFENVDVEGFETGVAVNDWVRSLTFRNGRIANNQQNV